MAGNKEFEKRKQKLLEFFKKTFNIKDKYGMIFLGIMALAIVLRLLYFTVNKAVWWDEAVYLVKAKSIALGTPDTGFGAHRSIGMPLIWSLFYLLGANEWVIRVTELVASLVSVWLVYRLGKDMFNEEVGLISSFLLAVSALHLFYTERLLIDNINLLFSLLLVWFFWKGLKSSKYMYIAAAVGAIGLVTYSSIGFLGLGLLIFLIIYEKGDLFKQKKYWIALAILVLVLAPWLVYNKMVLGSFNPTISQVAEQVQAVRHPISTTGYYLKLFPYYLSWPYLAMFFAGILTFIPMVFSIDILMKKKKVAEYQNKMLTLLWIIVPLIIFSYLVLHSTSGQGEDRYLLYTFPAMFFVVALGLWYIFAYIKKFNNVVAFIFLFLLLVSGAAIQIRLADAMIKGRATSYYEVRQAGEWMKQNSVPGDIIISHSVPQNTYYSERRTEMFTDQGKLDAFLKENSPKYFVVSVFESSPQWFYNYPFQHNDTMVPVKGYFSDAANQKPLLIIYQLK